MKVICLFGKNIVSLQMEKKKKNMEKYQEFNPNIFSVNNMLIILLGAFFGYFAYKGGDLVIAISLGVLYVGSFLLSDRVTFNNENIKALKEEIEELKKRNIN